MKANRLAIFILCIFMGAFQAGGSIFANTGVKGIIKVTVSSEDTARISYLISRGFNHLGKSSFGIEKVEAYIDSASLLLEKKSIDFPPLLHLLKAEYYYATGDFSNSEEEAKLSIEKAENTKEYKVLARTMLFLGRYSLRTGSFKESIDYYEKSIELSREKGLKGIIPGSYFGQANVYIAVGDLAGYRKNLQLMIEAGLAENDYKSAETGYYQLGTSFCGDSANIERRNFTKADSLLRRGLEISIMRKDTTLAALSLANIGWNFYLEKMYDSSFANYNKSLRYSLPAKIYSASANSLGNIGTIYRDLDNPEKAIAYYQKAIDQAKMDKDWYDLQWIYMDMSNMYLRSGDTSNAFNSYVLYKKFSDSWIKSEASRGLTDARIRYEADTHNKEVALLSLRLKNNRILNIGFTGLIILLVTIGLLIFRSIKIDAKRRISEMNHKISELTQANLRQQMNPHFIFNTLNSIQYYMYQHDKLATNTYLTKFSSLMRKVLDNSNHTSIPLHDELDALTLYLDLERLRFKDKFSYEINVDEEIDPLLFKVPTMLIQPYVENSICHGLMPRDEKGVVKIDMKLDKDHIICTIEDNGIGREAAQERKKMRDANHNSVGTQIAASRLDLVNSLYGTSLDTVYTDLKNERGEPVGTRVEIHIPVMT
jgi:tetratricopeptide (TPR) repeat protein